jgi:hypothetical protein
MIAENPSMNSEEMTETLGPFLESSGFIDDVKMAVPYCEKIVKGLASGGVDTDPNKDTFKKLATAVSIPSMENFVETELRRRCPRCNARDEVKVAHSNIGEPPTPPACTDGSSGTAASANVSSNLVSGSPANRMVVHFRVAGDVRAYSIVAPASRCWPDLLVKAASKLSVDAGTITKIVKVRTAKESEVQAECTFSAADEIGLSMEHGDWFEVELQAKTSQQAGAAAGQGGEGCAQDTDVMQGKNTDAVIDNAKQGGIAHASGCAVCDGTGWVSDTVSLVAQAAADSSGQKKATVGTVLPGTAAVVAKSATRVRASLAKKQSRKAQKEAEKEAEMAMRIRQLAEAKETKTKGGHPGGGGGTGKNHGRGQGGSGNRGAEENGDEDEGAFEDLIAVDGGKKARKADQRKQREEIKQRKKQAEKEEEDANGKKKGSKVAKTRNNRRGATEKPKTPSLKSKRHGVAAAASGKTYVK